MILQAAVIIGFKYQYGTLPALKLIQKLLQRGFYYLIWLNPCANCLIAYL